MNAQTELLKVGGSALALVGSVGKISSDLKDAKTDTETPAQPEVKENNIDVKMAAKARKTAQMKIKAIQANKEISDKARARRIGKVLDEFAGGNK